MNTSSYWKKHYYTEFGKPNETIVIKKVSSTDWSSIEMMTNDSSNGLITLRSQEHAEQLHFMLGQMLDK